MKITAYKCDDCDTLIDDMKGFTFYDGVTYLNGDIIISNNEGERHYCKLCTAKRFGMTIESKYR